MPWSPRKYLAAIAAATLCAVAFACCALAQGHRTIRMIVPFAAGGPIDTMTRLVAEEIGGEGGPAIAVENHPGAGTVIGTELIARAAADGSTLGVVSNSLVVPPHLRKLNYDPLTSFEPVCIVASFPPLLVVNSSSPYRSLADLITAARAHPGTLTLGTLGPATASQIVFEMLKRAAGVDIIFVPFSGYTPAVQALLGGYISVALADYTSLQGALKAGSVRALATTAGTRAAALPDIPTVAEAGYKDVAAEFFGGVVAPAKTAPATLAQLIERFKAAIKSPAAQVKFATLGLSSGGQCGADFAAVLRRDDADYGRIIRDANIKLE
jgi:tripartite-type tricarboxylate transporter receptor subunit TctC